MVGMLDFLLPAQGGQAGAPFDMTAMSPWLRPTSAPEWATIMPQPGGFGSLAGPMEPLPAPIEVARPPGMLPPTVTDDNAVLPPNSTPAVGPALSLSGPSMAAPATQAAAPALPQGSLLDRIGQGINDNSGMLMALGAGLAGSSTLGEGLSRGLQLAQAGGQADRKRRSENATAKWLQSKGYSEQDAAAIAGNPAVLQSLLTQSFGKAAPEDIQMYEYAKKQGYTGTLSDWIAAKRAGAGEYALQGIPVVDKDGNPGMMQLGKSGTPVITRVPEGFKISKQPIEVDAKTKTILLDPITRQVIGEVPKDIAGASKAEKIGAAEGEATVALPGLVTGAERMLEQIDAVKVHPGRGSGTGAVLGRLPGMAGAQLDFVERMEQLQGQTFVRAFDALRGAGAITEEEGRAATKAMARLNRAKDAADMDTALEELKAIVRSGIETARRKAGGATVAPGAPAASGAPPAASPPAAPALPPGFQWEK